MTNAVAHPKSRPLDPMLAIATVEVVFDYDGWMEDWTGDDKDAYLRAKSFRSAAVVETKARGDEAVVCYTEKLAADAIRKWLSNTKRDKVGNAGSDGENVVYLSVSVDSVQDVVALRRNFYEEGRSYDVPYCEITGLMLFPQGVNGPRYGLEASNAEHDLDEWLEAHTPQATGTGTTDSEP